MKRPGVFRQHLPLRLEPRVRVPELRRQHQTAKRLGAARVDGARVRGSRGARQDRVDERAGVVQVAHARVQAGDRLLREQQRRKSRGAAGVGHGGDDAVLGM